MLDVKLFRETPDIPRADLKKRGRDPSVVDTIITLDKTWRHGQQELNDLRAERNDAGRKIAEAKKSGGDANAIQVRMKTVADRIKELDTIVEESLASRDKLLRGLPNIMHPSVPVGKDDSENQPIEFVGEAVAQEHRISHVDLVTDQGWADLEKASKVAGARFYYLKGDLVLLAKAIETLALHELSGMGFELIQPPYMLRRQAVEGAVDLADFEDVIYKIEGEDLYLIATSEHPLAALHMDEILPSASLPLRYAGVSPCFRKEAGSHGKDTKGIFRVHQFDKVEQFIYCKPEDSWDLHEELIENAKHVISLLELPFRVVNICTGDLGTVAAKKYDIEVWMPVQQAYREVVSCSNCTDYQARRYNTRHRKSPGDPTELVHTLNSTAVAIQRALVGILENHQLPDGRVQIPVAVRPFMGGRTHLIPKPTHQSG